MRPDIPTVKLLGVPVARLTSVDALVEIERLHGTGRSANVCFVNAHSLNMATSDARYRDALLQADLVLNDGFGVAIAARLHGVRFPENLNGTDFTPRVLELARDRGWRVYLLGAKPGVAATAAVSIAKQLKGIDIVGVHDGFFADAETEIVREIGDHRVDVLLVGMGNPAQERWLDRRIDATGARVGVAVGAFLDFAAGEVPRAPLWLRRLRLEWTYRLAIEPRRMWRRYVVGNPLFLWRASKERIRLIRSGTRRHDPR